MHRTERTSGDGARLGAENHRASRRDPARADITLRASHHDGELEVLLDVAGTRLRWPRTLVPGFRASYRRTVRNYDAKTNPANSIGAFSLSGTDLRQTRP
jgi:hypothetical protein